MNTQPATGTFESNIELDLEGPPKATQSPATATIHVPEAPAAPIIGVPPKRRIERQAGVVDPVGAARAIADEAAARKAGFSPKPPIYTIGSQVNSTGVANFQKSRSTWDKLPSVPEACNKLIETIANEKREDLVVAAADLAVTAEGKLTRGGGTLTLTEKAIEGFARLVTPGGARYLSECPPALRADNLNYWLKQAYRVDAKATKAAGKDAALAQELTIRTRKATGKDAKGREAYAVVGPQYAACDVDAMAKIAADKIGGDARCDVTYDGFKVTLDVLFHSNIAPHNAVAGEIFKGGIRIQTADDGSGSSRVKLMLWRNLCLNLIVLDWNKVLVGRRRHVGTSEALFTDIGAFVEQADERIKLVVDKWSECSAENVLERYDLGNVEDVIKGLVLNGVVKAPGISRDEMQARLRRAWEKEPGYSKTSFLNAITRAAHEEEWRSWEDVEDLESAAGELMYAKVWNCVPPKDVTVEEALA